MSTRTKRISSVARPVTKAHVGRRRSSRIHHEEKGELCSCGNPDVGSPMLRCGECHRWYHFRCADLTERDAEELAYYICTSCAMSTGKKSREHWELDDTEIAALPTAEEHEQSLPPSSDDEAGSEDNFVAEPEEAVLVEDPPSDHSDEGIAARMRKRGARKRKSVSKQIETSIKRHKATESAVSTPPPNSADDPIRKSCLELLIKLLTPIFSERLPDEPEHPAQAVGAEQFATELEACIFNIYGDQTDFDGKVPGNKYKERIRMLNFNLGKKDRKELRQSIRVGRISPDDLSRMSSIDLANSQAQQEAHKLAEEAMNHSILQARTAPLRKITHKGEQVIEQSQEEENWRIQEEEAARERERELQRSQSNTIGSVNDVDRPRVRSLSDSFTGGMAHAESETLSEQPVEKSFDPASAVFSVDFDGDGPTLHEHGPPTPPGLSGDLVTPAQNVLGEGLQMASPTSTSVSPVTQNFSLDGIFGSSEPVTSMWNDIRESEGSVSAHSHMGDDTVAPPDDADFDAFITVDEDEVPESTTPREEPVPTVAESHIPERTPLLADIKTIWQGHVGMPSMNDPSHMIQFQAQFKQVAGAPFHDIEANRRSLFPLSLFEIIGRVPTAQAINYLVSMRLNPTKELFACVLAPNEGDKAAYLELHKVLIGKDRYGLVFPWGQDPPLSAPGKELYIAPLLPEHPIPEYLQLLDNVTLPAKRDTPIFCGIFVLSKGRVTTLDATDIPHPTPPGSISSAPLPAPTPASSVTPASSLTGVPPVPPSVGPSLSNLSEDSLATLSKDLANLTPNQLELVRSLLIQQPVPAVAPPAQPLAPVPPPPPATTPQQHMPSRRPPPHQGSGPSGTLQPPGPPPGRSPAHTSGPLHWDRPRASYPDHGWEPGPGPGPARYGRDDYGREDFGRDDFRRDDFRRDDFRRDDFGRDDFSRDGFGRDEYGRNEFPHEEFRRDEFRRDEFRRDDFMRDDFGREAPRDDWPPYGRPDLRDDRPVYRGRGGGPSRFRGRGRGGPPPRW